MTQRLRILIADDEKAARHGMTRALRRDQHELLEAEDGTAAVELIRTQQPELVFLDLDMPELDGRGVLRELAADGSFSSVPLEIIVVTANDSVSAAVECVQLGASDYIIKPFEVEQLRSIARRAHERLQLNRRVEALQQDLDRTQALGRLVGVSRPMRTLFDHIERAAPTSLPILIRGETGTGKELLAREIHRLSGRSEGPFVAVNTAAIAESLTESELFGHVRGAFTGADSDRDGVFRQANGGSIFLDEIGDMPTAAQTKILRTLQEGIIQPVGSGRDVSVDVRVISATHQDLESEIDNGHFRQDLYFRLKGVELSVPPLRHRREDIILLANYFLERLNDGRADARSPGLATDAVDALLAHPWPGNVRELEQAVGAAAAMSVSDAISARDLGLSGDAESLDDGLDISALVDLPLTEARNRLIEMFEVQAIGRALDKSDGNISAAARLLGIHRQSLQQKMKQLGLRRPK